MCKIGIKILKPLILFQVDSKYNHEIYLKKKTKKNQKLGNFIEKKATKIVTKWLKNHSKNEISQFWPFQKFCFYNELVFTATPRLTRQKKIGNAENCAKIAESTFLMANLSFSMNTQSREMQYSIV